MIDNLSKSYYHDILENYESRVWDMKRTWKYTKNIVEHRYISTTESQDLKASSCCLEDNIARGFEVRRRYQKG